MKQGCKIIDLGDMQAISCGGDVRNHECDENEMCYDTKDGERYAFTNKEEADKFYESHLEEVISCSVACSKCHRAAIDDLWYLDI